jgi:hypothetical protein
MAITKLDIDTVKIPISVQVPFRLRERLRLLAFRDEMSITRMINLWLEERATYEEEAHLDR